MAAYPKRVVHHLFGVIQASGNSKFSPQHVWLPRNIAAEHKSGANAAGVKVLLEGGSLSGFFDGDCEAKPARICSGSRFGEDDVSVQMSKTVAEYLPMFPAGSNETL